MHELGVAPLAVGACAEAKRSHYQVVLGAIRNVLEGEPGGRSTPLRRNTWSASASSHAAMHTAHMHA